MAGMLSGCGSERHSQVSRAAFRSTVDGKATDLYTLRNARGLEMTVTNFRRPRCRIMGARPRRQFRGHRAGARQSRRLRRSKRRAVPRRANIGRYGNRIAAGRFGSTGRYTLPLERRPQQPARRCQGLDMVVWDVVEVTPQKIVLACLARQRQRDTREPGTLTDRRQQLRHQPPRPTGRSPSDRSSTCARPWDDRRRFLRPVDRRSSPPAA